MRTLIHLSDLHFGRFDSRLLAPLIAAVARAAPDLIAISGDLTQRARGAQFREASAFLKALDFPQLVVPGNHDVPLYNLAARFLSPLGGYCRHITPDLEPVYMDEEMAVVGVNTARSFALGHGRINAAQVERIVRRFAGLDPQIIRVIVTHHPFDLPEGHQPGHLLRRADMAMRQLASVGADLFLAGHLHLSHIGQTGERYRIGGHSALVVQAGTVSTRSRGELSSFNIIRLARPDIAVERTTWDPDRSAFAISAVGHFRHTPDGWIPRS